MRVRKSGVRRSSVHVRAAALASTLGSGLWLAGCPDQRLASVLPCTHAVGRTNISQVGTNEVDLLFVVDDSQSMKEEQTTLAAELPRLVRVLTTGQLDEGGAQRFPPVDLHVGVVSTNLGGFPQDACKGVGDDARLRWGDRCSAPTAIAPTYLGFAPGAAQRDDTSVTCMVELGIDGCGFEQQLEAGLKALTPSTSSIGFRTGVGQGDGANAGFLRERSLVVVLLITDEDDCSSPDLGFLRDAGREANLACAQKPEKLYPVSRYVEGLRALRPARPDGVLFAAITGVPTDLVADPEHLDYDAILADTRMQFRNDGQQTPEPEPACRRTTLAKAAPARRIVEVAQQFGANGIVQSICSEDYRGALTAVLKRISQLVGGACLSRELIANGEGLVDCDVIETLPSGEHCAGKKSRSYVDTRDGRERCRVDQVATDAGQPRAGEGWYFDSVDVEGYCAAGSSRIRFTVGATSVPGARVDVECLEPILPSSEHPRNEDAIGMRCDVAHDPCPRQVDPDRRARLSLFCDARSNTCQAACSADSDCRDPMVCDTSQDEPYCVNPTCGATGEVASSMASRNAAK